VVSLIDAETWIGIGVDVKGAIYEGLLERNAAEVKSGAGQYFTPRPLIQAMVHGAGAAHRRDGARPGLRHRRLPALGLRVHEGPRRRRRARPHGPAPLREATFSGVDIVDEVVRLAAMNLYLHGIAAEGSGASPIRAGDALAVEPGDAST
jgi:type I restriction enzyme M protein